MKAKELGVCEYCSTSFLCERLSEAVKIVDVHPELLELKGARETYAEIKARLAETEWDYAKGGHYCALSGHTAEVRRLTDELIEMLTAARTTGHRSHYDEECHCE